MQNPPYLDSRLHVTRLSNSTRRLLTYESEYDQVTLTVVKVVMSHCKAARVANLCTLLGLAP